MYTSFVRRVGLTCLVGIAALGAEAQGAATMALKAVAKNGVPIAATSSLAIAPNDTITVEVQVFGWNNPPFDGGSALVQVYQADLNGTASVISNGGDINDNTKFVLPVGWDAPVIRDNCPCDPGFPVCNAAYGCVGNNHLPNNMASLNTSRNDYILKFFDTVQAVSVAELNIRWGGTITTADGQSASRCVGGINIGQSCLTNAECPSSTCDQNYVSYGGTLNLKAGSAVCGTTTYSLANDINRTFIANTSAIPTPFLPILQGLTLTSSTPCAVVTGACCDTTTPASPTCSVVSQNACTGPNKRFGGPNSTCANIDPPCAAPTGACCIDATGVCTNGITQANCAGRWGGANTTCANITPACVPQFNPPTAVNTPANCLIDSRQPFPAGTPAQRQGFTSQVWTFQNVPGTGEDAANDFTVSQVPATTPPVPPTISTVVAGAGNTVTLTFSGPIQPNKWTCIKHNASNTTRCIGYLPGDVNFDRTTAPADILKLVDNLNGIVNPALGLNNCDIDRSGACLPPDIVKEIDLLNGASGYPVQNTKTLPACPSAP